MLGSVCKCLLNEPQRKHPLLRGVFFGFWGRKWCIPVSFWVTVLQYPYPLPLKKKFSSDLHWSQEWSRWAPKSLKAWKRLSPVNTCIVLTICDKSCENGPRSPQCHFVTVLGWSREFQQGEVALLKYILSYTYQELVFGHAPLISHIFLDFRPSSAAWITALLTYTVWLPVHPPYRAWLRPSEALWVLERPWHRVKGLGTQKKCQNLKKRPFGKFSPLDLNIAPGTGCVHSII